MPEHLSIMPRRGLNARQAVTVEKLFDAALTALDESPYDDLTMRQIASRAGLSPATAYTYFSSKEFLYASLFWRHIVLAEQPSLEGTPTERLTQAVQHLAALINDSPALAAAATKSLLSADTGVERLRTKLGRHWIDTFSKALGDDADHKLVQTLGYTFSGILIASGMGQLDYADMPSTLETSFAIVMQGH